MLDERVRHAISCGSSHIVALQMPDGRPLVMRGWGATVPAASSSLRVLLDEAEVRRAFGDPSSLIDTWIAFTTAVVRSLVSFQVKGRISAVAAASDDDRDLFATYCDEYYEAVLEVDFIARSMMERMEPTDVIAVEFVIGHVFDQTPGPGAGREYTVGP